MTAIDASLIKFHISLNASDLERSIAFYRVLFGTEPAKVREDYAKFELAEPPLVLSLIPGGVGGNVNHAGLRVRTADELVDIQRRLETAGIVTQREEGVECCYARQTKFWVADPDRVLWGGYLNPRKNTPSIAEGLDGDEFRIGGASTRLLGHTKPTEIM